MTVTTNQKRADAFKAVSAKESSFNASFVHTVVLMCFSLGGKSKTGKSNSIARDHTGP
jgi:hypothetical protein